MSYLPLDQMAFRDGPNLDAFGRLRVSNSATIFDSQQEYSSDPLVVENVVAGTATAVHSTATNSTTLSTFAATANNRAMRQSKVYWRYQPGKSQLVKMTGVLAKSGTPSGTTVARLGYYDDSNGVFFGRDSTGYFVCVRTNTSGSVVDTRTYQSSWNIDKLNGSGSSGEVIDFTKTQIFIIDLQWLGVGRVRFGVQGDSGIIYVHEILKANFLSVVYMRTANLPLRYEVFNVGGTGSVISLECICMALESEGGVQDEGGYSFCAANKGTSVSLPNAATLTPVLTLRLRDTFNGLTYRGHVHINSLIMSVANQAVYWELIWNAATLTGTAYTNVDTTYSGVEFDVAATAYTGGTVIQGGYETAATAANRVVGINAAIDKLILARTYANVRDTVTLAARGLGGAATIYAAMNFEEQY